MSKPAKIFLWLISLLIIVVAALGFWLYNGQLTQAKIKVFSFLPFPAASVNGHTIPISQYILRYNLSKSLDQPTDQSAILAELINEKEAAVLASSKGLSVAGKEIDADYNKRAQAANLEGRQNFDLLLAGYGISPAVYKSEVVLPALMLAKLQTWFYSQADLNQPAYATADNLVQKIQNNANMSVLASQYSDQSGDRSTGGDLGFLSAADLLPELAEPVDSMNVGEVKILPSRYGIQVIKVEDKQGNNLHLREIFIQGSDFNNWYQNETKNYNIKKFVK